MLLAATILCLTGLAGLAGLESRAWGATGFPPSTKVVLFTPPYTDPLVARLDAELAAVGIAVRRLPMPSDADLDSAITREITSGASAAIRVIPRSRGTEVWTGETTARMLRRRAIRADTSDAALSVIALRTVEFLRASLLDVKRRTPASQAVARNPGDQVPVRETATIEKGIPSEKAAPADKVSPATVPETPAVRAPEAATVRPTETPTARPDEVTQGRTTEKATDVRTAPPSAPPADRQSEPRLSTKRDTMSPHFEIAAGPALVASPGGTSPITSAAAIGRAWLTEQVGIEMMALFPMIPSRLTNTEGSIEFKAAVFGGGATFRLTPPGRWTADVALGVSAILFRAAGAGVGAVNNAPNMGRIDSVWKAAAQARIGGGVEINRWLLLRADVLAGMIPSSRIQLASAATDSTGTTILNDRATWGPTFAAGTVGLQANW